MRHPSSMRCASVALRVCADPVLQPRLPFNKLLT